MHVIPGSTTTMADFGLLWAPCLRERLPLDILSHLDKQSWLNIFACLPEKIGCPGPSERRMFEA